MYGCVCIVGHLDVIFLWKNKMLWLWVSAKERYHCHDNDDCGCCVDDIELIRKKGGSQKERKTVIIQLTSVCIFILIVISADKQHEESQSERCGMMIVILTCRLA